MRVVLAGPPAERARLRARLPASIDVVGEAASVAAARSVGVVADAILSPPPALPQDDGPEVEELTPRELDVLRLMVEGLSNKSIGERLAISDQTVKFHVAAICGKLGAANRTDAVRRALRRGVIDL